MARTTARTGKGVQILRGQADGPPETFTALAELKSMTPPKFMREWVDATHTDSDSNYKDAVPGLKDAGELSAEFNFVDDAQMTAMLADYDSGAVRNYKVTFPTATARNFVFAAGIAEWGPSQIAINAPMTRAVKLKLLGAPTVNTP